MIGEWEQSIKLWNYLKRINLIKAEKHVGKELLYALKLGAITLPKEKNTRLLTVDDYQKWRLLREQYDLEIGLPHLMSESEEKSLFTAKVKGRTIWGLFLDDQLTTIGELNAKALDLGQVGSVFTMPNYRNQGLATALMRQIIIDAKEVHHLKKLMIFTGERNFAAQKVYLALGAEQVGHFALLFGC